MRIIATIILVATLGIASSAVPEAGTYYVSPTGSTTWANCINIIDSFSAVQRM